MKSFFILTEAINYIEQGLCQPITRVEVAEHCYVSLSTLEKLFRYALHHSMKEYITKRRISQASKDLFTSDLNITEIAMKYQYNSPEVFTRSFKQVWHMTPSEFIKKQKFTGIFPKINYNFQEGDDFIMARKRIDLTEAYDYFKDNGGTYVLCFDLKGLLEINNISRKIGDLAILEMISRINSVATDDMLTLRIGGDEFALITGLNDLDEAQKLMDSIVKMNGNTIDYEEESYPVSLWAGIATVPQSSIRYGEFFTDMHKIICESKC